MPEAMHPILEYGFEALDINRIQALVILENEASIGMLEKLGFRNEGLLKDYERWGSKGFVDLCMYAVLRIIWKPI